jgi:hypothetical protein
LTKISLSASHKGAQGEHIFEGHFLRRGVFIASPKHDLHRVDYVVEWKGQLAKVNVKTLHFNHKQGAWRAETKTSCPGGNSRAYSADEIDYFGVVSLEYGHIWMVPLSSTHGVKTLNWHHPSKHFRKRTDSFKWDQYLITDTATSLQLDIDSYRMNRVNSTDLVKLS